MENIQRKICNLGLLFMFIFLAFYVSVYWYDADMYHLIATGRDILANGFIKNNSISIFGGEIVIQQWLYAVIIALVADHVGGIGLYLLNVFFFLITSFLAHKIMSERGLQNITNLVICFFVSFSFIYINIRPEWITLDLILLEIYIMEKYRNSKNKKILYLLVIIELLEINLHAAYWIFHFVYFLPYFIPPIIFRTSLKNNRLSIRPFIIPIVSMIATLFINPYGIENILYVFRSYGLIKVVNIRELKGIEIGSFLGVVLTISFFLLIYLLVKQKLDSIGFYMMTGSLILCSINLKSFDKYPIFLLFMVFALSGFTRFKKVLDIKYTKNLKKMAYVTILFVVIYGAIFISRTAKKLTTNIRNVEELTCCELYGKIDVNYDDNIYCGLAEGAYLSYLGYDHLMLDSRPELWSIEFNKKTDYLLDYLSSAHGYDMKTYQTWSNQDYDEFISAYNFDCIIIRKNMERSMDSYLMDDLDYDMRYETDTYRIYFKK